MYRHVASLLEYAARMTVRYRYSNMALWRVVSFETAVEQLQCNGSKLVPDLLTSTDAYTRRAVLSASAELVVNLKCSPTIWICDYCIPVANVAARSQLRSAGRHQVVVPRYNTSTFGRRAFSVAGPTVWNSQPDKLSDPSLSIDSFRRQLKTFLFAD